MCQAVAQCPICKGKGYKWDKSIFLLTFAVPLVYLIESGEAPRDDGRGFKQTCGRCAGTGYIKVRAVR